MWRRSLREWVWRWRGAIASIPSVTAILVLFRSVGWLQPLELGAYDALWRWRQFQPTDSPIVIVGITEADITETFQRPTISDGELARLIEVIGDGNPRAIGLDIYRDLSNPPGSDRLQETLSTTPNLIGIRKVVGEAIDAAAVLMETDRVGANDVPGDGDGRIRRTFLFVRSPSSGNVPGWGLRLAQLYLQPYDIIPQPAPDDPYTMQLGEAIFPQFQSNDGGYVGADDSGYQIFIDYRPTRFDRVSVTEVFSGEISPDLFRDRVVLIGFVAESANDFHWTPIGLLTGVEIQAHVTAQIIASALGKRQPLRTLSEPVEWVAIVAGIIITSVWSWHKRHQFSAARFSVSFLLSWGTLAIAMVATSAIAFAGGWWLPIVPIGLGMLGSVGAIAVYLATNATKLRQIFGRYITDEVVSTLLETPEGLKFNCRRQVVTILMSDLRGFSTLSEQLAPEQVVELLDIYLEEMINIITRYQGTINEFMGDGILVFFGAPTSREDDVDRAVACALAMEAAMPKINQRLKKRGFPEIEMGIGINTGEVVVGNIGSAKRAKWSVIGSHINLAARIETCTVGGQIFISDSTKTGVSGNLEINGSFEIEMKGFENPIAIHDVIGISGKYNLKLPLLEENLIVLERAIEIQYRELSGKSVGDRSHFGRIVRLSSQSAEIEGTSIEEPLTNLKIHLVGDRFVGGEIYAKVTKCNKREDKRFYVRFTATTPLLDKLLEARLS